MSDSTVTDSGPPVNYRNIRYQLLPGSKAKARQLFGLVGACRFIWNHPLARNQEAYRLHKENADAHPRPATSFFSLGKAFTELRNSGELPWLQGYSFAVARAPSGTWPWRSKPSSKAKGIHASKRGGVTSLASPSLTV